MKDLRAFEWRLFRKFRSQIVFYLVYLVIVVWLTIKFTLPIKPVLYLGITVVLTVKISRLMRREIKKRLEVILNLPLKLKDLIQEHVGATIVNGCLIFGPVIMIISIKEILVERFSINPISSSFFALFLVAIYQVIKLIAWMYLSGQRRSSIIGFELIVYICVLLASIYLWAHIFIAGILFYSIKRIKHHEVTTDRETIILKRRL